MASWKITSFASAAARAARTAHSSLVIASSCRGGALNPPVHGLFPAVQRVTAAAATATTLERLAEEGRRCSPPLRGGKI
jgi:hypothetical protein